MSRMTVQLTRLRNARVLCEQQGGITKFADRVGKAQSLMSRYIGANPERKIGDRMARDIEKAFNKPMGWLDVSHVRGIEPEGSAAGGNLHSSNVEPGPALRGQVPLISWVMAGQWCETVDTYYVGEAEDWFSCPVSHGDRTYALRVLGASMEPRFFEGDLIFVDPDREPANGDFVVVRLDERSEATFKKLRVENDGDMWLEAINPAWPERYIRVEEKATFCGVAIFKGETL